MSIPKLSVGLALVLGLGVSLPAQAADVVVFAAASMKNALDELGGRFQADTGNKVIISYAGSNALAKQIIEGAPADLFISAAVNWMDEVEKAGKITTRQDLLGNSLVLVAASDKAEPVSIGPDLDMGALLQGGMLSMALVDSVPAGQYGKAALEHLGLWSKVAPSVAQSDNVRAALTLVSRGETPYGIVYATDAAADPAVSVVATFPADSHPAIIYPAALLKGAQDEADQGFYDFLSSQTAREIFQKEGFVVLK